MKYTIRFSGQFKKSYIDSTSKVIKKIGCCFGKDTIMNLLFCCLTQELTLTSSKHLKN